MCEILISSWNALMIILKLIFIDETITTCSAKSCGSCGKYVSGFLFRALEFGTISAVPPIILINYSDKYSTIIAAIASFFGMKFFTKLIEFFSEESMSSMIKNIRESNARLEEENKNIMLAISKLPTDMQTIINTELTELNNKTQKISDNIDSLKDDMKSLKTDFESSLQPYVPYDSPSNGD